jgi:hypothetical protein
MKHVLAVVAVALLAGLAPAGTLHASPAAAVAAGPVKVTLHYKGKGKVDGSHKLWVWIFDTPNIGPGAMPIDQASIDRNDSEVVFDGVAPGTVFIAAAFDEQGVMVGDGPPPTGSPIGILSVDGKPSGVTPGEKGIATLTFDDTLRMP